MEKSSSYSAVHSADGDVGTGIIAAGGLQSRQYPHLLTRAWRLNHASGYMLGCVLFLLGSFQYMPTFANFKLGGWLFTVGSAGFIYADCTEWWRNNRVGCCWDSNYSHAYELQRKHMFSAPAGTWLGDFQRAESGLNVALSVCGSILYFTGSILFLPVEDALVSGLWVFVWGGVLVMVSQSWKVYRTIRAASARYLRGQVCDANSSLAMFCDRLDFPAVVVDAFGALGACCYLVGSVFLLPEFDISAHFTWIAAYWFIAGGISYVFSATCQFYRYFGVHREEFSSVWCDWDDSVARGCSGAGLGNGVSGDTRTIHLNGVELTSTASPIFTIE
jgi:hypothetical protein